ncbi:hypothetical protein C8R47DRAFT_1080126 [Mycena vitilis]|nr:hypothetical protein C8R47DRAFT_1080126 [Mycena vitilis]
MAHLAVLLFPGTDPEQFLKAERIGLIWAVSSFITETDMSIAAALVFTLRGMKSSLSNTNRLMALGGLTAVIIKVDSNTSSVFCFSVAPLYVVNLLSNFNLREGGKSGSRTWSSSRNNNTQIGRHSDIVIEGIRVRRDGGLNDPICRKPGLFPPRQAHSPPIDAILIRSGMLLQKEQAMNQM